MMIVVGRREGGSSVSSYLVAKGGIVVVEGFWTRRIHKTNESLYY